MRSIKPFVGFFRRNVHLNSPLPGPCLDNRFGLAVDWFNFSVSIGSFAHVFILWRLSLPIGFMYGIFSYVIYWPWTALILVSGWNKCLPLLKSASHGGKPLQIFLTFFSRKDSMAFSGSITRWDRWYIITQLYIYIATYIPLIVLANWVMKYMPDPTFLLGEPETTTRNQHVAPLKLGSFPSKKKGPFYTT